MNPSFPSAGQLSVSRFRTGRGALAGAASGPRIRIEYKYLVRLRARVPLLNDLDAVCHADPHSEGRPDGYRVASVYFDDLDLTCYHDKLEGLPHRFKLRLRFYPEGDGEGGPAKVEIKLKSQDRIAKRFVSVPREVANRLLTGDLDALEGQTDPTAEHTLRLLRVARFRPVIRIDYWRRAFFAVTDPRVRLTVDSEVRCGRFNGDLAASPTTLPVFPPLTTLLEVKTPGYFPFWLTGLVRRLDLTRCAISKYAASLQAVARNSSLAGS